MAKHTLSGKLNRWIDQAQDAGLDVTIEDTGGHGCDQFLVVIRRPRIEVTNGLEQYRQAESLYLSATRIKGKAAAFKVRATYYTIVGDRQLLARVIPYRIDALAQED